MDSTILDSQTVERNLIMQRLQAQYDSNLKSESIIHQDEDLRRLRVRLLFQEDVNDDLQDQLSIEDDRVYALEVARADLQAQLDKAETDAHHSQAELRAKGKEIETLKTELTSMNGLSKDSNKLLAEKLELVRELASTKPELDHLRGQATFQQKTLAEKLSLQRQLATIELELEAAKSVISKQEGTKSVMAKKELDFQKQVEGLKKELVREKREREAIETAAKQDAGKNAATSKTQAELEKELKDLKKELAREKKEREKIQSAAERDASKGDLASTKQAEFERQLQDLKKEVAEEKREREEIQSAAKRDAREWESKRSILEGKVEAMKSKLRATKEELREVQASLAQTIAQAAKPTATLEMPQVQNKSRKRAALLIQDNTIGTPDGIAVRGKRAGQKRGKIDQTSLGEKSMFSITPYLNKTTNLLQDTPKEGEESAAEEGEGSQGNRIGHQEQDEQAQVEIAADPSPSVLRVRPEAKSSKKAAAKKPKVGSKKASSVAKKAEDPPELQQVAEEVEAEELPLPVEQKRAPPPAATKPALSIPTLIAEASEPKKKKRKLGSSKTIFDEEDAESTKRPAKVLLATNRPLAKLGAKKGLGAAPAAGFAPFSPLKKHKRGVQASFLG